MVRDHINSGIFCSDIMHRIQLDCEHIKKIWLYSNKLFHEENSVHKQLYYYFYAEENYNIDPLKLLQTVLKAENNKILNQFELYVMNLQLRITNKILIQQAEFENVRRIFFKSFFVFLDVVQNHILTYNYKLKKNDALEMKFNQFINNRLLIMDRIQRYAMKNKVLYPNEIKSLFEYDTELFIKLKDEILSML